MVVCVYVAWNSATAVSAATVARVSRTISTTQYATAYKSPSVDCCTAPHSPAAVCFNACQSPAAADCVIAPQSPTADWLLVDVNVICGQ